MDDIEQLKMSALVNELMSLQALTLACKHEENSIEAINKCRLDAERLLSNDPDTSTEYALKHINLMYSAIEDHIANYRE